MRTAGEKGWRNRLAREHPSAARCREICRALHGRLASLAPGERVSAVPLSLVPLWCYPLAHRSPSRPFIPPPRYPLTHAWTGVACRIKKAFTKSRCLSERCKIETVRPPLSAPLFIPRTSLSPDFFLLPILSMISDFLKIIRLPLCSGNYHLIIRQSSHFRFMSV